MEKQQLNHKETRTNAETKRNRNQDGDTKVKPQIDAKIEDRIIQR